MSSLHPIGEKNRFQIQPKKIIEKESFEETKKMFEYEYEAAKKTNTDNMSIEEKLNMCVYGLTASKKETWCTLILLGYIEKKYEESLNYIEVEKKYTELHKESNLKFGDIVIVTRKAIDNEKGWNNAWAEQMDKYVGKQYKISLDDYEHGFQLLNEETYEGYSFPCFVLEKVNQ